MNTVAPMKNRGPWTKLMVATLPVWFGLVPLQAEAVPDEVGGNGTNMNRIAPLGEWTPLNSVSVFNATNQRRFCIATCSADMANTGAALQSTLFTLTPGAPPPTLDTACERTLQFHGNTDVSIKEITTTCGPFLTEPGPNSIRCWARPVIGGDQAVLDRSITVSCTDTLLP